jgi:hypothetical protein
MSIDVVGRRPTLMDAINPVLDLLTAAGIRVTLDSAQLNPPGCLLLPPVLEFRFNAGDFTATYTLIVTVGSSDRTKMISSLSDYLALVLDVLGDLPVTGRPVDVTLADKSTVLPGFQLGWTTRIRHRK